MKIKVVKNSNCGINRLKADRTLYLPSGDLKQRRKFNDCSMTGLRSQTQCGAVRSEELRTSPPFTVECCHLGRIFIHIL